MRARRTTPTERFMGLMVGLLFLAFGVIGAASVWTAVQADMGTESVILLVITLLCFGFGVTGLSYALGIRP